MAESQPRKFKSEITLEAYMRRHELSQILQMLVSAGVIDRSDATGTLEALAKTCRETPVEPPVEDHKEALALAYEALADGVV
ncbi:hypothetical protein [Aurantimonas sp. A3-2-R12]|uniref:hypothetical protein n=1 Tax=Aurantimonas sp. A3-2-R12 TaxID=3114362 RepID=UPI002E18DC2E|nr:hypothetical protein [Aurantimonas sp. A3-2-R12]